MFEIRYSSEDEDAVSQQVASADTLDEICKIWEERGYSSRSGYWVVDTRRVLVLG
jgi:hypothetical protein